MLRSPNFQLTTVAITAGAVANAEFTVAHGLTADERGLIPRGSVVVRRNLNALLYDSGTAWTDTTAYFKSDTANAQFAVMFY